MDEISAFEGPGELLLHERDPVAILAMAPVLHLMQHLLLRPHPTKMVEQGGSFCVQYKLFFGAGEKIVEGISLANMEERGSLERPARDEKAAIFQLQGSIGGLAEVPVTGEL